MKQTQKFLALLLSFLIPSNALTLFYAAVLLISKIKFEKIAPPVIASISLYLSSLNSTKKIAGDLITYHSYSESLREANFAQLLASHGNEIAYYLLNWIAVHELKLSWNAWVFFFSFLFYSIYLYATKEIVSKTNMGRSGKLAVLLIAALFPITFAQSAHLVRQYLAGSLITLGIAYNITNRKSWLIFTAAALFHTSSAIFILLPIMSKLKFRSKHQEIAVFSALPTLLILGLRETAQLAQHLALPEPVKYGLSRISQEKFFHLDELSKTALVFAVVSAVITITSLSLRDEDKENPYALNLHRTNTALTFYSITAIASIVLSLVGVNELAVRFLQYNFLFLPISLGILAHRNKKFQKPIIIISLSMPILFAWYPTAWSYAPFTEIFVFPFWHFF